MNRFLIALIAVLSVSFLFTYYENKRRKAKLLKINTERPKLSKEQYIEVLERKGFEKVHIEVLYDALQDYLNVAGFAMHPQDDIHKLYGMKDFDDVELIDEVCKKLNLPIAENLDLEDINKNFSYLSAEYILTLTENLKKKP